jgi:hypothetical protein
MHKIICDLTTGETTEVPLTDEEIAHIAQAQAITDAKNAELAKTQYQRDRAAAYPAAADYLDGIVKGDQAQIQAYVDACLAVKAKYPKPKQTK